MSRRVSPRHRLPSSPRHILPAPEPRNATHIRVPMGIALTAGLVLSVAGAGLAANLGLVSSTASTDPHTLTFRAAADTYVAQASAKVNNGHSVKLVAGAASKNVKTTLLQFNVAGIPAGATKVTAKLVLHRDAHHLPATTLTVQTASTAWTETGATWLNRPAAGTRVGALAVNSATTVATIPITAAVRNGTVAFSVSANTTTDVARFDSRETSSAPQLVVSYANQPDIVPPVGLPLAGPPAHRLARRPAPPRRARRARPAHRPPVPRPARRRRRPASAR